MWHINGQLDWQTGEKAGAGATFQVIELKDDEENDLTDLVDQGRQFHSIAELKQAVLLAIAGRLEITEAA
jgi:type I restriction enzyme, S subunit